jgi:GNAT superfamily N-acetyltransferase
MPDLSIERLTALPPDLDRLRCTAAEEGYRFLERMAAAWRDGSNRFDREGESLLGGYREGRLVTLCGLNRDPYEDPDPRAGRLRHLYVLPVARRSGIGSALVLRHIRDARHHFGFVQLRADTPAAADFYVALGFSPCPSATATHRYAL